MKIKAIQKLNPETQQQITEWSYRHFEGLAKSQSRYLTFSLITCTISLIFLTEQPERIGYGPISVSSKFFILWFPILLSTIAWGLVGSIAQMADSWSNLKTLLNLKKKDLGIYDIDPKPNFADHVNFPPKQMKCKFFNNVFSFISKFFYDIAYIAPILLAWYYYFTQIPETDMSWCDKAKLLSSIIVFIITIFASIFALHTFYRRQIRKLIVCVKKKLKS